MASVMNGKVVGTIEGKTEKGAWKKLSVLGSDELKTTDKVTGSGFPVVEIWDSQTTKKVGDKLQYVYAGTVNGKERYIIVG